MKELAHQFPLTTVLLINVLALSLGYTRIYPPVAHAPGKLALRSLAVDGVALTLAATLFAGQGIPFPLLGFNLNWFVFAIGTLAAIELPLFLSFGLRHGWPQDPGEPPRVG
jgi:hypothetical protein